MIIFGAFVDALLSGINWRKNVPYNAYKYSSPQANQNPQKSVSAKATQIGTPLPSAVTCNVTASRGQQVPLMEKINACARINFIGMTGLKTVRGFVSQMTTPPETYYQVGSVNAQILGDGTMSMKNVLQSIVGRQLTQQASRMMEKIALAMKTSHGLEICTFVFSNVTLLTIPWVLG